MTETITHGSLFSGIGGFDLGFERAGMETRWQVENDAYAIKVLEKHWPDVKRYGDITELDGADLEVVDVISGGFPCQDISLAGKGAGINGKRSGLWKEMLRIVREVRPRYVVVENVPMLLHRGMGTVLGGLAESGYDCEWDCIPAAAVGAPHLRDRALILAYSHEGRQRPRLSEISEGKPDAEGGGGPVPDTDGTGSPRTSFIFHSTGLFISAGQGRRGQRTDGQVTWEPESGIRRVATRIPKRVDRLRCLGNAFVPQVAEYIGTLLVNHIGRSR